MKRIGIALLFLMVCFVGTAENNPFIASHPWLIRSAYGREVCTILVGPISGNYGTLFVFPAEWVPEDDFFECRYLVADDELALANKTGSMAMFFPFMFTDEDNFVLYFPRTVLEYRTVKEVLYYGEATIDQ